MTTINEIATAALKNINVAARDEPADANDLIDAIGAFNDIMHELVVSGHITTHTTQSAGDTFALAAGYNAPMAAAISVRISDDFDVAPSLRVARLADTLRGMLDAADRGDLTNGATPIDGGLLYTETGTFDTLT